MTSTKRGIPADGVKVNETTIADEEWRETEAAHARLKETVKRRPGAKARFDAVLAEIEGHQATLGKLRQARALTQTTIAELLEMDQSEVSRLERRSDLLLSTLRRFVQATGGDLKIVAYYPDSEPFEVVIGAEGEDMRAGTEKLR